MTYETLMDEARKHMALAKRHTAKAERLQIAAEEVRLLHALDWNHNERGLPTGEPSEPDWEPAIAG